MKTLISFLVLIGLGASIASGSTISKADQIATIEHLRANVRLAQSEMVSAKSDSKKLQVQINEQALLLKITGEKLAKADEQIEKVTTDRNKWRDLAHKLLFLVSALAGGIAGLAFLNFSARILVYYPPALPYSAVISGGIGILVASFVWIALEHL